MMKADCAFIVAKDFKGQIHCKYKQWCKLYVRAQLFPYRL